MIRRWRLLLLDPNEGAQGEGAGGGQQGQGQQQQQGQGQQQQAQGDDNDAGKSNKDLIREKAAARRRAQEAEGRVAALEAQVAELTTTKDQQAKVIAGFEFADKRRAALKEEIGKLPADQRIDKMDRLEHYVSKVSNPETMMAEIKELVSDFTVAAGGQTGGAAGGQREILPQNQGGSGASDGMKLDLNDPYAMAQAYKQNPAAFTNALTALGLKPVT